MRRCADAALEEVFEGGQRRSTREPFVSITTFRRDGTPVSVPVWCAADHGSLLVFSEADLEGEADPPRPPCPPAPRSARGHGPAVDADASLVEETTKVRVLLARKYGWAWRGYRHAHGGDGGDPAPPPAGAVAVADDQDHTPSRRPCPAPIVLSGFERHGEPAVRWWSTVGVRT